MANNVDYGPLGSMFIHGANQQRSLASRESGMHVVGKQGKNVGKALAAIEATGTFSYKATAEAAPTNPQALRRLQVVYGIFGSHEVSAAFESPKAKAKRQQPA